MLLARVHRAHLKIRIPGRAFAEGSEHSTEDMHLSRVRCHDTDILQSDLPCCQDVTENAHQHLCFCRVLIGIPILVHTCMMLLELAQGNVTLQCRSIVDLLACISEPSLGTKATGIS